MSRAYDMVESFDGYASISSATVGLKSKWINYPGSGDGDAALIAGRYGGQALRCDAGSSGESGFARAAGLSDSTFSFHVSVRFGGNEIMQSGHLYFDENVTNHVNLKLYPDGRVRLSRGGSDTSPGTEIITTSIAVIAPDQWHTLSGRVKIHDSAGEFHLALNGDTDSPIISVTGVDTRNGGTGIVDTIGCNENRLTGGFASYLDVDDWLMSTDFDTWIPERKCTRRTVTSDGGHLDLVPSTGTDHFAVVDETPVNSSDYLQGSAAGEYDLLGVQALSAVPDTIDCLWVMGYGSKTDAATRGWKLGVRVDASDDDGAEFTLNSTQAKFERCVEKNPDGTVDWDYAGFNSAFLRPIVTT